MRGNVVAKLLRRLADAVEKLDEAGLEKFLSDFSLNELAPEANKKRQSQKNKHAKVDPVALEEVIAQLAALSTRAAGGEFLDGLDLSRKQLEAVAKLRNIHVTKDDNVSRIKEKLVEGMIGARLSSRAIRGSAGDA